MLPSLQKAAGKGNVHLTVPDTGAEDFFFFCQKVLGFYFFIGGMPKGQDPITSGLHRTPTFFLDDSSFKTGIKATCNLVIGYMDINKK